MKNDKNDVDLKLSNIEKRIDDLHGFFKTHLTVISIVLAVAALILSYLSITSKRDVREAIIDMENKFETLSKQALKSPQLEIIYDGKSLDGGIINISMAKNHRIELKGIYLKNIGDGINNFLSYKLFFSRDILQRGNEWYGPHRAHSKLYNIYYSWGAGVPINPNDYWHVTTFMGQLSSIDSLKYECKLEVYYGVEHPTEAIFQIIFEEE